MQSDRIFIVDDDHAMRDALSMALQAESFVVESFADAESALDAVHVHVPSAMLLDVKLPGQSGMEALRALKSENYALPIVMMTGHGDVPMAVEAIKLGAYDFIEKPFSVDVLLDQLKRAVTAKEHQPVAIETDVFAVEGIGGHVLTRREREVLREIAAGASSKETGRILGISPRTVEVHRARIMDKLGARNAADLMRIIFSHS